LNTFNQGEKVLEKSGNHFAFLRTLQNLTKQFSDYRKKNQFS